MRDALGGIVRRWYVVFAVLLAFAVLTTMFYRDGGSFSTRTTVTFTLPSRSTLLPESGLTDLSIISFAGAVATSINAGKPVQTFSSSDAPYYGAGVREGIMVSLRNTGSQFISSFPSATIDIQIVGRTREWVSERQQQLLDDIMAVTDAQQTATLTPESDRITATIEPLSTEIHQVSPGRSDVIMAVSAMTLAALVTAFSAAVVLDRIIRRERHPRRQRVIRRGDSRALGSVRVKGETV
ncbi:MULTISPECIES: hypothetical protein [unclassified Microbacterium]|uniref:hypothetical protein n=1 Tax=unclassified Microbacterium TaxID=2609290 RepID=UPI001DFE2207|nr:MULTISPECIES: hypothetical protein [unclassified Microbacterium]CAH0122843.1 hypothetical protein SRABI121_00012 [Microbacterium sp. Bi121]HWK76491.1 hypothetical protein [Microbacterium sp.]